MRNVRSALIHIAHENPEVRSMLLPVLKSAAWEKLPKGWTQDSVKKFWESLTGDKEHKVTECMKKMEGKFDDPAAFCASLRDKVEGSTAWRGERAASAKTAGKILSSNSRLALVNLSRDGINAMDLLGHPAIKETGSGFEIKIPAMLSLTADQEGTEGDLYVTIEMVDADTMGLTYRVVSR